jgi:CheY-like chemotaxis protein
MKKLKIIFVDNDEDEQLFMKEGFESTDLFDIIHQANDGSELFDYMDKGINMPDIILSDLNMPGKSGYDILTEIKEHHGSEIPVIITSTSSAKMIIDKCLSLGAAGYMVKPETFTEYPDFAKRMHKMILEKGFAEKI